MTEAEQWGAIYELLKGRRVGRGRPGVEKRGECWVFLGSLDACGYGCINRSGFMGRAHRYVWREIVGPIPDGMQVLHRCDNPACVRPSHLWLGTQTENIHDMFAKGRGNIDGLTLGTIVSRHKRMTEWTPEQRKAASAHAQAGRTLRSARKQ